jgi:hypothetical protein
MVGVLHEALGGHPSHAQGYDDRDYQLYPEGDCISRGDVAIRPCWRSGLAIAPGYGSDCLEWVDG